MSINLRPYQQEAIDKMFGKIDENGRKISSGLYDDKRFAAVFLPTGGGKSFVSMDAMDKVMTVSENSGNQYLISDTPMLYLSPNTPIIGQYQIHMAQNMIFEHHISKIEARDGKTSRDRIKTVAEEVLKSFHPDVVIEPEVMDVLIEKNPEMSEDKLLRLVLKSQLTAQDAKIIEGTRVVEGAEEKWIGGVRGAFPKLQFKCYQSMRSKKSKESIDENSSDIDSEKLFYVEDIDADFIIMDEAHRGAAEEWSTHLEALVDAPKHKNTKYLAITATPDRDADDYSIINTIASKTGYTSREVRKREYTAQYLELIEAMKQKLVVTPKVIHLNCTLDQTKAYREVVEKLEELNAKKATLTGKQSSDLSGVISAYEAILGRMHALMGRAPGMTDEQWRVKQEELVSQAIRESGLTQDAKCIGFIPRTEDGQNPQEHIQKFVDDIKSKLMSGLDLSEEQVYSKAYHSAYKKSENDETLRIFNKVESKSTGVKVVVTNAKLNEGVHVDDTQALFMYDEIRAENASVIKQTPKIKFMQQIGRCIFSIDPNGPEPEQPLIFDMAHSFLWQHHLLKDAQGNPFFDMTPEEAEFIELYNIFLHNPMSVGYRPPQNVLGKRNINPIEEAIKSGSLVFTFKEKDEEGKALKIIFPEGKPELTPNLIRKVRDEKGKRYNSKGLPLTELAGLRVKERFEKMLAVLTVLEKYGVNVQNIDETIPFSDEFLEANGITGETKDKLLDELFESRAGKSIAENFDGLVYPIGDEMKIFKDAFYGTPSQDGGTKKEAKKLIDKKPFEQLVKLGIISVDLSNIPDELKGKVSSKGFIIPNENVPEKYWGLNIKTGDRYFNGRDEFGLDENGLDICGYDKDGFKTVTVTIDGKKQTMRVHKVTGQDYDDRFFRLDEKTGRWINTQTGKETDLLGYGHEGIETSSGFDRGIRVGDRRIRLWHKKVDGVYSRLGSEKNEYGANQYGFKGKKIADPHKGTVGAEFNDDQFASNLISKDNNSKYNWNKYNADGERTDGFTKVKIKRVVNGKEESLLVHSDTSYEYDLAGRDEKGRLHPDVTLTNEIIDLMISGKMTPEQVYQKFKDKKGINEIIDRAFVVYAISPKLEIPYTKQQLIANKEVFNTLAKLSPRFKVQMDIRQADKQAMREELRKEFEARYAEGNLLQSELEEFARRDRALDEAIIVRPDTDEGR